MRVWIVRLRISNASAFFFCGFVHCSRDLQVQKNANLILKLGPIALFIPLKIILL